MLTPSMSAGTGSVGLRSVGSFTTSFGRTFGLSPRAYRAANPPAADRARIPTCMQLARARPQSSSFREDNRVQPANVAADRSTTPEPY
jgi:hypothetical protein